MTRTVFALGVISFGLAACSRPAATAVPVGPAEPAASAAPTGATVGGGDRVTLAEVGRYRVERDRRYTSLIADDILWATQSHRPYLHPYDVLVAVGSSGPWDGLLFAGSLRAWDPTLEPLTYYHRDGPVGAMVHVLRVRRGAPPPVGVIGLHAGTPAAYAVPGQAVTFYERDPALKKLVADTDRYFTFLADARNRGAVVDVRVGPVRQNLERDADKKFGLLLVELYDTGFDPGDRLTLEAIRLYLDRTAADGVVALHISNKDLRLEPVVAAIAAELKLAGRVWHDEDDRSPGQTAASWVVLARDENALGAMAAPTPEQAIALGTRNPPLLRLLQQYGPGADAVEATGQEWFPGVRPADGPGPRPDPNERAVVDQIRRGGRAVTLGELAAQLYGPMFRPLRAEAGVGVRRDGDTDWPAAVRGRRPRRE